MIDFTAIDFETANGFRGSACSIGMVRVRHGKVVARNYQLLRPPEGYDRFDPRNTRIHQLTTQDVAHAPRFGDAMEGLMEFIGTDTVFAHNAGFDLGVIESGMEVSLRPVPAITYGCTLMLSRKVYQLASHALPSASAEAGFDLTVHHHALDDAEACAAIVIDCARRLQADSVADLMERAGVGLRQLTAKQPGEPLSRATRHAQRMGSVFDSRVITAADEMPDLLHWPDEGDNPEPNTAADPDHPLFDQHVVFTGNLGISRQEAKNRAATYGAHTASRVNGSTTMLVVGDGFRSHDLQARSRHPARTHKKMREVLHRNETGQSITIVTEPEFLQMLDYVWPAHTS
ncbi:DNA polymerase III subunit epsilon [Auritidibacter sp. NML130574]|uniref:exonuclease domain-containing protein n=1 Tax=Auritidibacter sp. NML130574 TaxID=2170745 RepID=UPI000D727BD9|nr:exonuclease domain-containing protein [Auritidibacter sp. NML130574]AXR73253.1 DNA polymerase III subunit epsilon [Auritidibacter sp. NML130574]